MSVPVQVRDAVVTQRCSEAVLYQTAPMRSGNLLVHKDTMAATAPSAGVACTWLTLL